MGERRKWDKQPPELSAATPATVATEAADPVREKQVQYIKMLEERNRLKKKLAAASKKETRDKQREDAFVTAFNVAPVGTQDAMRKNKSAAALLPTRMHGEARGRSAPSTTLPLRHTPRGSGEDAGDVSKQDVPPVRRAKWSKPADGAAFEVENRNGKATLCVGAKGGSGDEGSDSEDEYLEESFEEFEGAEKEAHLEEEGWLIGEERSWQDEKFPGETTPQEEKPVARAESKGQSTTVDASSSSGLSRTTTDLFAVIQTLSRSKQKMLVDVLQKFEASAQQANDVQSLQSSIGDPAIWKQVTAALFGSRREDEPKQVDSKAAEAKAPPLTVTRVMEEQLKWEEEYARQMQDRLMKERQAKEQALLDAEQRRVALLKQMEDEEKELEQLMEKKRQERLAKMKAMEQDNGRDDSHSVIRGVTSTKSVPVSGEHQAVRSSKPTEYLHGQFEEITETMSAPASASKSINCPEEGTIVLGGSGPVRDETKSLPTVPVLNLSSLLDLGNDNSSSTVEIRLRLLSTWGKTRAVGLAQICVYDIDGNEVSVDLSTVKIYEQSEGRALAKSHEMMRTAGKLFDGIAQTNSDQEMWLGRLSDHGMLDIAFELKAIPSKLCVWNYNSRMCSACTRDLDVLVNGKAIWSGSLPQGFGEEDANVCVWISVTQGQKKTVRSSTTRSVQSREVANPKVALPPSQPSSDTKTSSGPIWLSTSASTSVLGSSVPAKADPKDDLLHDLDGLNPRIGSLTSRRHRAGAEDDKPQLVKPERSGADSKSPTADQNLVDTVHTDRSAKHMSSELSPSWDSLEHFSKTSRSRLFVATEEPVRMIPVPSDQGVSKFVPSTTSALLTELRSGSKLIGSSSMTQPAIEIPELPNGCRLKLQILSTWGDQFYVGLNGIELFDHRGKLVTFSNPERQVTGCPSNINVLDEYDDDPRVAKNLVDGINSTCDDFHMWLAPYNYGEDHYVVIQLDQDISLSMVRVWNYNKSRAHTFRGARHVRMTLYSDASSGLGRVIFEGEIRRAPGGLFRDGDSDSAMWCEVILFTSDLSILKEIERNDAELRAFGQEQEEDEETSAIVSSVRSSLELRRPKTADRGSDPDNHHSTQSEGHLEVSRIFTSGQRPTTSAAKRQNLDVDATKSIDSWVSEEPQQRSPVLTKVEETDEGDSDNDDSDVEGLIRGRRIAVRLLSTWGDRNYVGLTQLDVLVGKHGSPTSIDLSNINATPRDLATLGYEGDPRTLDKLVNGIGTSCDDSNMWLIPFGASQEIQIDLKRDQLIYGIRVWNYNKSLEDSFRGVKQISISIDGVLISPRQTGYVLRKAPGNTIFDFAQIIRFSGSDDGDKRDRLYTDRIHHPIQNRTYKTPMVKQDYEPTLYPQGFVLKLVLWTTWGDPYYVGLNGIDLFDSNGKRVSQRAAVITADPHSLGDIDRSPQEDVRVPENLLSEKNKNTWDASDAWLAPLASSLGISHGNVVYIVFDVPIVLSLIKFWNYSKTPERGAKDIDIYLDDLQIYSGTLRKAPHGNDGQTIRRFGSKPVVVEEFSQPVLFSTNQAQVDAEKRKVYYCGIEEQDVLCINDGQVVQESKAMYRKPDPGAEGVFVDLGQRPVTALTRK